MSEEQYRLPLMFDNGALTIGEYAVIDIDGRLVGVFDTEEDAAAFIAKANGTDVETVRRRAIERGRMLAQYRENLIRASRERNKK